MGARLGRPRRITPVRRAWVPIRTAVVARAPTATTLAATSVTDTGATLNGTVVPNNAATTYQFEYGPTTSYGTRVPAVAEAVGSDGATYALSQAITGLTAETAYHVRIVATNSAGTTRGADETFTTDAASTAVLATRVVSEPVDDTLTVTLTHANGRKSRWAGDEPDASGIPQDIEVSTAAPGGFQSSGLTLARDPRRSWPDLGLVDHVEINGRVRPLGRSAFEGQCDAFPADLGDSYSIGVQSIGYQTLLEENESWRQVYVDRDVGRWGPPTLGRRQAFANVNTPLDVDYTSQSENGGVSFSGSTGKSIPAFSTTELWYRMPPGQSVAAVDYKGTERGAANVATAAVTTCADDDGGSLSAATITLDDSLYTVYPTPKQFAFLGAQANALHTPTDALSRIFSMVAVYGNTGVPLQAISGEPRGVHGHDALAHMLSTGAPLLNYRIGYDGTIWPAEFVVPQLAFHDPGKVSDAIGHLNAYFLRNWAVWERRSFWWQPWSPDRLTWRARIQGGAHWAPAGADAENLVNGVIVSYTDVSGIQRTAGPVGSGCDDETDLLLDTRESNPFTARNRRKWRKLDVGFPLTNGAAGSAVMLGFVWLQEQMRPQRSGTLVVRPLGQGHIPQLEHPTAGPMPLWACRAGDYVELVDYPEPEPFRIIDSRYSHESKTLTLGLDNSSARISAVLERLGVRQVA